MDFFLMVISGAFSFYWVFLFTTHTYLLLILSQLTYTDQIIPFELSTHPKHCLSVGTRSRQVRVPRVLAIEGPGEANARAERTWRGRVPSERQVNARSLPQRDSLHRYEFTHPQMGTVFRLVMYAESETQAQAAATQAFAAVDSLNASMSDYLPDSELSRLCNQSGNGQSVEVSEDLWQILKLSDRFSRQSGGAFDATVGPLTRLWRRARNLKEMPDSARIEEARQMVGFQNISFKKGQKIELKKTGMRLDLGGIAQGYAADRCLKILRQNGIRRALADAGGDIALGDAPPGETGWTIEIPASQSKEVTSSHLLTSLRLANCGITTSGATFRYLEAGGKRYSHIVDPRTGWGMTHRVLVTVQAPDATTADAWATAISVLGESGWKKLKRKHRRLKAWLTETPITAH
ncbi:MAG: FAD:protein FMN transferase [Phycisphaerae bacterium]|nr:FAD:protein FMN transferase [Saprospiraceae bacterium]